MISESDGAELNIYPSCQFPVVDKSFNNLELSPKPDDTLVQNGITVLPVKWFSLTNVFTGHAAIPHHTTIFGNPAKKFKYVLSFYFKYSLLVTSQIIK